MLNGIEYTLTFLKDVTFGVLYEQIKAQDQLKRMINKTLQQKIQMPLQTIARTCETVVATDELKEFELMIGNSKLSCQMDQMFLHCKLVMLRLDDMQDIVLMIDGKFRKRSNFFEFDKTF